MEHKKPSGAFKNGKKYYVAIFQRRTKRDAARVLAHQTTNHCIYSGGYCSIFDDCGVPWGVGLCLCCPS